MTDNDKNNLGSSLRWIRKYCSRMTASEFANSLNVSKSYISEIENGKKPVTLKILSMYSNLLDISHSSIFLIHEKLFESGKRPANDKKIKSIVEFAKSKYINGN